MYQNLFGDELLKDEKILWTGQPETSVRFTRSDVFLIPFSGFFGIFSMTWMGMALRAAASGSQPSVAIMPLFGVPFILMGLYLMFGRFWYKALKKRNTYYALTNKRVMSLTKLFGVRLNAMYINAIPVINKTIGGSGTGTLIFGNLIYPASMYANTGLDFLGYYGGSGAIAFYDIRDAEGVYQQIARLR